MKKYVREFIHKRFGFLLCVWRFFYNFKRNCVNMMKKASARGAQSKIDATIAKLKTKATISVGFYVYNAAAFPMECVFKRMLDDPSFDPYIVVSWGKNFSSPIRERDDWEIHKRSVVSLRERYGENRVLDSFDGDKIQDFSSKFDLCSSSFPYEDQIIDCCKISYLANKGIPVFFAWYGFEGGVIWDQYALKMPVYQYLWRFYTGTESMKACLESYHPLLRKRSSVVLSGAPKIEPLSFCRSRKLERPKVIIAPHHTIDPNGPFYISNFVKFAALLVDLPRRYPQIDWIFRPHPNLASNMVNAGVWTDDERRAYFDKWEAYPNAVYQRGGDYFDDFVNSTAMIQDCCSFLAEYHATGHPQCYMLKSESHAHTQYDGLGLDMLNQTYKAYSEDDIVRFIESVVIAGKDVMRVDRLAFLEKTLLVNYPHVSEFILNDIKATLNK